MSEKIFVIPPPERVIVSEIAENNRKLRQKQHSQVEVPKNYTEFMKPH
jgi:hypothetical protein